MAGRLHAETGGNPLALVELSAALTADQLGGTGLPEVPLQPGAAIQQRFATRLDQLSPHARIALLVAAAAGRCPAAEVRAGGAASGRRWQRRPRQRPRRPGLVRIGRDGVAFSHPLLRSAAYHAADPAQRRAAHRALADVQAGRDAERTAWHLAAAATGPDEAAATALDAAAALAAGKGAPLAAAASWERAAELSARQTPGPSRLAEAAEAALNGGDLDRARHLTETLPDAGQPPCRARMLAVKGRIGLMTGQMTAAQPNLEDAADLTADGDPRLAVELFDAAVNAGT